MDTKELESWWQSMLARHAQYLSHKGIFEYKLEGYIEFEFEVTCTSDGHCILNVETADLATVGDVMYIIATKGSCNVNDHKEKSI